MAITIINDGVLIMATIDKINTNVGIDWKISIKREINKSTGITTLLFPRMEQSGIFY